MGALLHELNRSIRIGAAPETVFRFFTDSDRWARWWGPGSTIDARPGGKVLIRYPNAVEAVGEVIEVLPPERFVFAYGYASGTPIAAGSSRVTILLTADGVGTRLRLRHEFEDAKVRDQHVQGWRFQLAVFGNIVSDEANAGSAEIVDRWFEAWSIADDGSRRTAFEAIADAKVLFRDRFSLLEGVEDLTAHAGAAQRFMPGIRMSRKGEVRHCQGTVLAEWTAAGSDGTVRMSGTNVFVMGPGCRIHEVTGVPA
jgi:uncharacterized protein YndB with AHSA1/START domain